MRVLLVLGSVIAMFAILSPGCSGTRDARTVINFWAFGAEGENVRDLIADFERLHPDIHVRVQAVPWTAAHEKLLTAFAGGSMPDLFQLGNTWIPEMTVLDAVEPLDQWIAHSQNIRDTSYFPGIWATNRIDSVTYGVPWYVDTRVIFYRKDIFARAGFSRPPTTWGEWQTLSQRIIEQGGKGQKYSILLPTTEWAPPVILGIQAGSSLLKSDNTRGNFSGPEFTKAFTFYVNFFKAKFAPIGNTQVVNLYQAFAEGYFAMYISGPWNVGEFKKRIPAELQDDWMTAPLPGPDSLAPGASLAGGSSFAISRSSSHKEAAWKLVEFLSDPVQQIRFYKITGDLPARRESWADSALAGNVYMRAFHSQLMYVLPMPPVPEWEQIAVKVQDYADLASREHLTVDEAMRQLDRDVNRILEKRRWMKYEH